MRGGSRGGQSSWCRGWRRSRTWICRIGLVDDVGFDVE